MDGFKGKLGIAVGFFWKGMAVFRAYNKFVSNPNTDDQKLVRARFALLGNLAGGLYPAVKIGYKKYADSIPSTQSGEFVKDNYSKVSGNDPATLTVAYDELKLCNGKLIGADFGTPSFTNPLEVSVPISNGNATNPAAHVDDVVYVMVYCPDMGQGVLSDGTANRSDQAVTISVPTAWQGMKVHCYGFVAAGRSTGDPYNVSPSDYIGFGNIS